MQLHTASKPSAVMIFQAESLVTAGPNTSAQNVEHEPNKMSCVFDLSYVLYYRTQTKLQCNNWKVLFEAAKSSIVDDIEIENTSDIAQASGDGSGAEDLLSPTMLYDSHTS